MLYQLSYIQMNGRNRTDDSMAPIAKKSLITALILLYVYIFKDRFYLYVLTFQKLLHVS